MIMICAFCCKKLVAVTHFRANFLNFVRKHGIQGEGPTIPGICFTFCPHLEGQKSFVFEIRSLLLDPHAAPASSLLWMLTGRSLDPN